MTPFLAIETNEGRVRLGILLAAGYRVKAEM